MKPIKFKQVNCIIGEGQPQYLPLPAYREYDATGMVISCWKLSFIDRIIVVFTGKIWWGVLTFNQGLQPQMPWVRCPFRRNHG